MCADVFGQLNSLVAKSARPINDGWLEWLQYNYKQRHNYYRFLYHLVRACKPAVSLEIGIHWGIGSAYMCAAAKSHGGQVIGIDRMIHDERLIANMKSRYGNYHFLHMDSTQAGEAVKAITDHYGPLGIIYQDSSHHYRASKQEWELYSPLADEGAIWICDDITPAFYNKQTDPPRKGMVQYFEELPGQKKLYPDRLHYGNTIGAVLL